MNDVAPPKTLPGALFVGGVPLLMIFSGVTTFSSYVKSLFGRTGG